MKKFTRFALLAFVPIIGAMGLGASPASAADDSLTKLTKELSQCAQIRGKVDVVFLLDHSQSLSDTDKGMVRRSAGKDLARELAQFTKAAKVDAQIQVATFDGLFNGGAWRTLSPESLGSVNDDLNTAANNEDLGPATDYWMALDGARKALSNRPADRAQACQMLVWFSDGTYDVDEGGAFGTQLPYAPSISLNSGNKQQVINAGMDSICSAKQGPMNALRAKKVFVATVGLTANGQLDFLERATTGSGNCGGAPAPGHSAYLQANQAGALAMGLARMGSPSSVSQSPYEKGEAAIDFGLDSTVADASVLAYAGQFKSVVQFGLSGPDGKISWWQGAAPDESRQVGGAEASFESVSGQAARFRIKGDPASTQWVGKWTVHFKTTETIPPDVQAQMLVTVAGDLEPLWSNPVTEVEAGASMPMQVSLTSDSGRTFDANHPGIKVSINYVNSDGQVTQLKSGLDPQSLSQPQTVILPDSPQNGSLSLKLDISTATTPSTVVRPAVRAWPLRITPKGSYPRIASDTLMFSEGSGIDPSRANLAIEGPGCVWVDVKASTDSVSSLPDGVNTVTLAASPSDQKGCLTLAAGEQTNMELTLAPDIEGNGSIVGTLAVMATPEGPGEAQTYAIGFEADRSKQEDAQTKWVTLVLVTLLGLLLGSVPLFANRARLAKIRVNDPNAGTLYVASKSFDIRDGDVTATEGQSLELESRDIAPASMTGAETVSELTVEETRIRAKAFGNPFGLPDCQVTRADGSSVVTSKTPDPTPKSNLPLALPGDWVAWHQFGDTYRVQYFVGAIEAIDSALPDSSQRLADELRSHVPQLESLRGVAGDVVTAGMPSTGRDILGSSAPSEPDPWGAADQWDATGDDPWSNDFNGS